ncbi:metallophosphatase domain-containing protein [Tenacibaculum sp.]|uniref:metallophosphatase domain-containing protein n=1 Tax=Tenacibaculum sp. TaxID=1906242 RepID=UPI003D0F3075
MKIVFISDTHGRHEDVKLPQGNVLIHAGDVSRTGKSVEVEAFLKWYSNQPHKYKILIAGNHDWYFESNSKIMIDSRMPDNIIYLNDSGCEIEGVRFWGSPIQPEFGNWAFNRKRGEDIKAHWDLIPLKTDVLITHGPPFGILDKTMRNDLVGCEELLKKVNQIKPKIHVFGHIHEAYGVVEKNGVKFINASLLNHKYYYTNDPVVVDFEIGKGFWLRFKRIIATVFELIKNV